MKKNVCDRCEKILPEEGSKVTLTIATLDFFDKEITKFGDLCDNCYDSFLEWLWEPPLDTARLKEDLPEKDGESGQPETIEKKQPEDPPQVQTVERTKKRGAVRSWKKDDIDKLIIGYKHQQSIPELAKELNRSEGAVTQRIIILRNDGKL